MNKSFFKICLVIVILQLSAVIGLTRPSYVIHVLAVEGVKVEELLGQKTLNLIDKGSSAAYNAAFIESGIYASVWHLVVPTENEKAKSDGIKAFDGLILWLQDRINLIFCLLFLFFERVYLLVMWAPSALIIAGASCLTGFYLRLIKQGNFSFASPTLHRGSIRILWIVAILSPFVLLTPVVITPYLYPIVFTVMSFMLQIIIANVAKRI